jgi:hypothetical protein
MMHTRLFSIAITIAVSLSILPRLANAGNVGTDAFLASYTVKFSEKEAVLIAPDDPFAAKASAWDHPFQRIMDRNMPWIEITNEGNSTAQITEFLLTIGDTNFNFSTAHFGGPIMESTTNPADIGISASVDSGGDLLVLNLTNFDPGEIIRFRIDIDPDDPDGFPHPDFRRVLFDMNGNNPSDNAEVELQFSNGITSSRFGQTLPDFTVEGPIFSESNIRPYSAMEPVGVFEITDQVPIPEPSTWILAALVMAASLALSKRQGGAR